MSERDWAEIERLRTQVVALENAGNNERSRRHQESDLTARYRHNLKNVVYTAERFLEQMDALENPRPAGSWFALRDALGAARRTLKREAP